VAKQIEASFAPLKRGQVAAKMLQNSFRPVTALAAGVAGGMALIGGAAMVAGGGIAFGVKKAMDLGGALADLSARTGASASGLMVMQQAFTNAGLSADQVGPAMNRMQKALTGANEDGDKTTSMFERLGLNMAELQGMKPDQQFQEVASAIAEITDPAERATAAMALFGKSGGEMLALFNDPAAFGSAAAQVGTQAQLMDRNAALFDDISDKLALAGLKVQGFFVGVADQVAPVLQPLLDWFANQDLAAQGQKFGLAIATAISMLTDGTFGQTLLLMAQNAGMAFANIVIDSINGIMATLQGSGFGFKPTVQLARYDQTGVEAQIGANVSQAMNKVFNARDAADKLTTKDTAAPDTNNLAAKAGGSAPSLSRQFATSAGLFVKDPLLAENRRQTSILEKINTGIQNLKLGTPTPATAGGNRFT
jgi:hypothetical protein